ncbi:hypothetical protein LJ656_20960 [Paraburkholderia sp. MMS20-SJTR3]|uniref:Uncharacterized protein n=1 Tax=Paraburkholderia sejongensis TaxID=2886946 RepID=A0ABS8JYT7_9BURK|nr:hypothetical protein [Paraburkholderia sp. MMS20-SJTR3]MCC8395066.1 hypothetical protein [Paraburkholderia sp. MMS20-SJTR3]
MTALCVLQRGKASVVSGQSQSAKDQEKRLRALFFSPAFFGAVVRGGALRAESAHKEASGHLLPSREGFNYNTGHFGAGNTVARRVIKPASPRNCRQEIYS